MAAKDESPREASMDEILSSIRNIISADGAAGEKLTPDRAWSDADAARPAGEPRFDLPPAETGGAARADAGLPDSDAAAPTAPTAPAPTAAPAAPVAPGAAADSAGLVSEAAEAASIDALARLAAPQPAATPDDDTLRSRQFAAELLRPMLREWLDANLPAIVEDIVRAEVRRLAERARR